MHSDEELLQFMTRVTKLVVDRINSQPIQQNALPISQTPTFVCLRDTPIKIP
jgi:hypothetical protein